MRKSPDISQRLLVSEKLRQFYSNKIHKDEEHRTFLGKKIRVKAKVCQICGKIDCEKKGICRHTKKFFKNLSYFGFNIDSLGSDNVFNEYNLVKQKLEKEYYDNNLSPSDLKLKYNYPKTHENITHILKELGIQTRNVSNSIINAILNGKLNLSKTEHEIKLGFKQGWHNSWDGKQFFYRSDAELKYAELLDKCKIPYSVESLRILYYDTEKGRNRVAIPDFLLIDTNEIVEVKSKITFRKQNIIDKFKKYKELGYKPKMLLEGVFYNEEEIKKIKENDFILN